MKQLHITVEPQLENQLNERGYAVIDLLTQNQIDVIKAEYHALFGNLDGAPGRFTTLQYTDSKSKNIVNQFISKQVEASLRRYFKDFELPISIFYTKKAHTSGDIELHCDSTLLLNHQLEPHYAVWVPLVDVGENNGTLTVVPGSHKVRGAFFSGTLGGYHYNMKDWLHQYEIPLHLRAGQAVIFDNNLLHNSTANKTDADRICFTLRITHTESQYYSFYCEDRESGDFEVYHESHNYYMDENWHPNDVRPEKTAEGVFKNSRTKASKEDLEQILK